VEKPGQGNLQIEFNRLVNRGVILGIVWIMGVGSVIALISGYQANKILKEVSDIPNGKAKVRKCFIIGIAGLFVWVIAITIIIVFRKK
jgi:hypothetical protein